MSLKQARQHAGLSVLKAAEELGVSDACVYQWETGQTFPSTARLPKIAELYGCTVDELLRKDEQEGDA